MRYLLVTICAFLLFATPVLADSSDGGQIIYPPKIPILRYLSENTTGVYKTTYASTTIVDPSTCKILGFAVYPISGAVGEYVAALHDTLLTITDLTLYGELEAVPENFAGMWFPAPAKLTYGLSIVQGAQTRVIIYYTRY